MSDLLLSLPLDSVSIQKRLGVTTVEKGKRILAEGQVLEARITGDTIEGTVQGSRAEPYRESIHLASGSKHVIAQSTCTCPVGADCKHVAAVLLSLAKRRESMLRTPTDLTVREGEYRPPVELARWLESVHAVSRPPESEYPPNAPTKLLFILDSAPLTPLGGGTSVKAVFVRLLKSGNYGEANDYRAASIEGGGFGMFVLESDQPLLKAIHRGCERAGSYHTAHYRLKGVEGARFLPMLVATGRLFWRGIRGNALKLGETRRGTPRWTTDVMGTQLFGFDVEDGGIVLPACPLWYVDPSADEVGPLNAGIPDALGEKMLLAPPIKPEQAHFAFSALRKEFPDLPFLAPEDREPPKVQIVPPVPVLSLAASEVLERTWGGVPRRRTVTFAKLQYQYGESRVLAQAPSDELRLKTPEGMVLFPRDKRIEHDYEIRLGEFGWTQFKPGLELPLGRKDDYILEPGHYRGPSIIDPIVQFASNGAETLRREGWIVEIDPKVVGEILPEPEWDGFIEEAQGGDWFAVQLGANVEGERIDLAPVLARVFHMIRARGEFDVDRIRDDGKPLLVRMDDGRILPLRLERLKPLLRTLVQLYGEPENWGELKKLPKWRVLDLDALGEGLVWSGSERLREAARKLGDFSSIVEVGEPAGFVGTLRDYQKQGLAWLQFLKEFGFGGILADDMGLGKTIQTLAHLLWEKQKGHATLPSLLVAPTSTLPNWAAEAEKFAPSLKVLVLRTGDRKKRLSEIGDYDLVITTYNLLPRDKDAILKQKYHLLILDEAQNVKNPKVAAAFVARLVQSEQRLCLSGTPVENHLGELWSLFHIVMPGLLGADEEFKKRFRTPIEKGHNESAQSELSRRIKPFLLRRTKEQVASELPPKTEIPEIVELEGPQRDLYETVRSAMDKRVRDALQSQGLGKSHIIILDALLKLRQICCDPRLVKIDAARDVKESAKLERLMEMLPDLIEDGRRVLLFSQFTSMLELIEASLAGVKIPYVKLTGETQDRATPVKRFQSKEVPLFLISLKAGGTGLNLTAADTVIHYDPWWNPAVERQATDRAHRIGQTQPVFVYKLVAQGTVEEKILELQKRKGALADALLDPTSKKLEISKADLEFIFGR